MNDIEKRFELLKMARELVDEAYTLRRATEHNKWLVENNELWELNRQILPHPPFEAYPTEQDVIDTADRLYNFVYSVKNKEEVIDKPTTLTTPIHSEHVNKQDDENLKNIQQNKIKDDKENNVYLPGWIRRPNISKS